MALRNSKGDSGTCTWAVAVGASFSGYSCVKKPSKRGYNDIKLSNRLLHHFFWSRTCFNFLGTLASRKFCGTSLVFTKRNPMPNTLFTPHLAHPHVYLFSKTRTGSRPPIYELYRPTLCFVYHQQLTNAPTRPLSSWTKFQRDNYHLVIRPHLNFIFSLPKSNQVVARRWLHRRYQFLYTFDISCSTRNCTTNHFVRSSQSDKNRGQQLKCHERRGEIRIRDTHAKRIDCRLTNALGTRRKLNKSGRITSMVAHSYYDTLILHSKWENRERHWTLSICCDLSQKFV